MKQEDTKILARRRRGCAGLGLMAAEVSHALGLDKLDGPGQLSDFSYSQLALHFQSSIAQMAERQANPIVQASRCTRLTSRQARDGLKCSGVVGCRWIGVLAQQITGHADDARVALGSADTPPWVVLASAVGPACVSETWGAPTAATAPLTSSAKCLPAVKSVPSQVCESCNTPPRSMRSLLQALQSVKRMITAGVVPDQEAIGRSDRCVPERAWWLCAAWTDTCTRRGARRTPPSGRCLRVLGQVPSGGSVKTSRWACKPRPSCLLYFGCAVWRQQSSLPGQSCCTCCGAPKSARARANPAPRPEPQASDGSKRSADDQCNVTPGAQPAGGSDAGAAVGANGKRLKVQHSRALTDDEKAQRRCLPRPRGPVSLVHAPSLFVHAPDSGLWSSS